MRPWVKSVAPQKVNKCCELKKISKHMGGLTNTIKRIDLIDIYIRVRLRLTTAVHKKI
jgi:hypothetical protein